MLSGDDADTGSKQFLIQVVHGKRSAGKNEEYAAGFVFGERGFAPHSGLLAPLIGARALDQTQILDGRIVISEDGWHGNLRSVEVEDAEGRLRRGVAWVERRDGLIIVGLAVIGVLAKTHEAHVGFSVGFEHSRVDSCAELMPFAPLTRGAVRRFAGAAWADGLQLPQVGVDAQDSDSRIGRRAGTMHGDV